MTEKDLFGKLTTGGDPEDVLKLLRTGRENVAMGWCQNVYGYDRDGGPVTHVLSLPDKAEKVCILGGIYKGRPDHTRSVQDALSVLHHFIVEFEIERVGEVEARQDVHTLDGWNDDSERTKADVLGVYYKAIKFMKEVCAAWYPLRSI